MFMDIQLSPRAAKCRSAGGSCSFDCVAFGYTKVSNGSSSSVGMSPIAQGSTTPASVFVR